jgi:Xaa-Pro aminopeptidase
MTVLPSHLERPPSAPAASVPFDAHRLDELLAEAGLGAVLATSPHNVRYLLGSCGRSIYELTDAIGLSRCLPAVAYRRGAPEDALYVGAGDEDWGTDAAPPWIGDVRNISGSAARTGDELVRWCAARLPRSAKVGVELAHLPTEAYACLAARGVAVLDASELLEELRAVKRPQELERVRHCANAVVDAMLATFDATGPGSTKAQVAERLRQEQTARGLTFRFALVAAGAELDRTPSQRRIGAGDALSLDSGATLDGWVADVARMGIAGEPTQRHVELLDQVDLVQRHARMLARAGVRGGDLLDAARVAIAGCDDRVRLSFTAHGIGLLIDEAPRLSANGARPSPATHAERPLRAGMVLSLESQVADPDVGLVKLEDTVIVTDGDPEVVAGHGRAWNPLGA